MIDGTYEAEDGWTFTCRRNQTATETYKVSWRSPEGKRGIIRDRMTVGQIEEFNAENDWQRGAEEFRARRAAS